MHVWHDHRIKIAQFLNQTLNHENKVATQSPLKPQHPPSDNDKIPKPTAVSSKSTRQRYGPPPDSIQRTQDRRAFSAAETANEDEEDAPFDSLEHHAYSASRFDGADQEDYHDEDRYAMMGRRDYDFNGSYDEEEGDN